jgi:hypothetical protein
MKLRVLISTLAAVGGFILAGPLASHAQLPTLKSHAPNLDQAAGVYKHRFANEDVSGDKFTSEDVFELVKLTSKTAYFRIHAEFYNGHMCALRGVADFESDALTYHGPRDFEGHPCVLKFTANEAGLITNDVGGYCRTETCGPRGGYGYGAQVDYPFEARRRIRYMPVILKSSEYASAVKEHNAHPIGTPAPTNP